LNELKKIFRLHTIVKYESAVPRPKKEEYDSLSESIRLRGQQVPIVCNSEGVVLDGHTRFEICNDYGITPLYEIKDFATKEEEFQYVIEANLNRRQLTTWQKFECYTDLIDYWRDRVKKMKTQNAYANKKKSLGEAVPYAQPVGSIAEKFHKSLGIKIKEMEAALYIHKRRMKHPILVERLRSGSISIYDAHKEIHKQLNDKERMIKNKVHGNQTWLECPSCNHVARRSDYDKVSRPE
jgi:hypothetical protein